MNDEMALLRAIAANPYDRARLLVYADWLQENGRAEDEMEVRRQFQAVRPAFNTNSISVGELIGVLLEMPLDAPVIYTACSDYNELQRDEVRLRRAEDQELIWREQQGYTNYIPRAWPNGVPPPFVTVCHFPGN